MGYWHDGSYSAVGGHFTCPPGSRGRRRRSYSDSSYWNARSYQIELQGRLMEVMRVWFSNPLTFSFHEFDLDRKWREYNEFNPRHWLEYKQYDSYNRASALALERATDLYTRTFLIKRGADALKFTANCRISLKACLGFLQSQDDTDPVARGLFKYGLLGIAELEQKDIQAAGFIDAADIRSSVGSIVLPAAADNILFKLWVKNFNPSMEEALIEKKKRFDCHSDSLTSRETAWVLFKNVFPSTYHSLQYRKLPFVDRNKNPLADRFIQRQTQKLISGATTTEDLDILRERLSVEIPDEVLLRALKQKFTSHEQYCGYQRSYELVIDDGLQMASALPESLQPEFERSIARKIALRYHSSGLEVLLTLKRKLTHVAPEEITEEYHWMRAATATYAQDKNLTLMERFANASCVALSLPAFIRPQFEEYVAKDLIKDADSVDFMSSVQHAFHYAVTDGETVNVLQQAMHRIYSDASARIGHVFAKACPA